jgi:hypothetical protein
VDDGFDLIVWYDNADAVRGFQICYDVGSPQERALTWRRERGFAHDIVDDGGDRPDKNRTPILLPDGQIPWEIITEEILRRGACLEPDLRSLVMERLENRK